MKKMQIIFTVAIITVVLSLSASAKTVLLGDINGDGKITASDARSILRFAASLDVYDEEQFLISDIDLNEKITAADARAVLRVSASLDPAFGEITVGDDETEAVATTEPVERTELKDGIGMTSENFIKQYGSMFKAGTSDGTVMYHNDNIIIVSDPAMINNQLISSITLTGGDYTLNGTYVGMTYTDAKSILSDADWTLKTASETLVTYANQNDLMKLTVNGDVVTQIECCLAEFVSLETSVPEETITQEPATDIPGDDTDAADRVSVDELPAEAKAFLSGRFGFDGTVNNSDGLSNDVILYTDGNNIRMGVNSVVDGQAVDVEILILDEGLESKTIYLLNNDNNKYCELNDLTLSIVGMKKSTLEFNFNVGSADSLVITHAAVTLDNIDYDIYRVEGASNVTYLYMIGDKLEQIVTQNSDGKVLTTISVKEIYNSVPENSFSLNNYNATTLGLLDLFDFNL